VQRSFDAGFKFDAKLDAPTSSFGLSPQTYKIALCNALVSDLTYCHGTDPGLLVQRNKSSTHECTVGRPRGGLIAEPFHPIGHLLPQFAQGPAVPKETVLQHDSIKAAWTCAPAHSQS
jgi:hypothetical protein